MPGEKIILAKNKKITDEREKDNGSKKVMGQQKIKDVLDRSNWAQIISYRPLLIDHQLSIFLRPTRCM